MRSRPERNSQLWQYEQARMELDQAPGPRASLPGICCWPTTATNAGSIELRNVMPPAGVRRTFQLPAARGSLHLSGRWLDTAAYAILKQEWPPTPA